MELHRVGASVDLREYFLVGKLDQKRVDHSVFLMGSHWDSS